MASGGSPGATSQASSASDSRLQRGIPSFKLLDDERARAKRFRNRVPSAGSRGDVGSSEGDVGEVPMMSTLLFQDTTRTPPHHPPAGPRRVSSFSLANDVFRSMSHASSWGSGAGGNMFGFGPASVDGEGEDAVQRLDDASFNDLNFLTMEGVGPSDRAGTPQKDPSEAGLDTKLFENPRAAAFEGGLDRYPAQGCGGNPLQATVPKEEPVLNAIVGRAGSARDSLSTTSSSRDLLGRTASSRDFLGSTSGGMMSRKDSGILGSNVFDLEGGLPTFSASMEEYLNRQLEAAEQSLDHSVGDGHTGEAGSSPILGSTRSVVVKSERDRYPGGPGDIPRDGASPQHVQVKGETLKPGKPKRRTRTGRGSQFQPREQQRQEHGSDEEAGSSHSEYEPPTPREEKAKKGRGRGRAATATATRAGKAGGTGARAASSSGAVFRRSSLKRQTSEDVAARLPLEVLECFYHVPLNIAAQQLSVSLTMLKKLCRAYGVKRWPHRQVSSLDKTTSRLEEKIKARNDGGKDAPSLVRKLTQAKKRRSVIIKTASAGLDATVLNSIFTCRPGEIDEDFLLASTDVAKAVEQIKFSLDADHKHDPESESESDDDDDDDDNNNSNNNNNNNNNNDNDNDSNNNGGEGEHEEETRGTAVEQLSGTPKKITCVRDVLATPPAFVPKPAAVVKSVSTTHPPAFEPGVRMRSAVPKKPDTKTGNNGKPGVKAAVKSAVKAAVKTERLTTPARRTRKVTAAPSTKGRKGAVAAAAAQDSVSVLPTHGNAAAAAAASPGSYISDGSGLDDSAGGGGGALTAADDDAMPASSPAALPFGSSPRSRAPLTAYSGVFGTGLHHQSSSVSGRGQGSQVTAGKRGAGDPFARSPATAQLSGGEGGASHMQQAAQQVPAWAGAGGKRAMGYGEWRGGVSSSQSSPLQQQQQQQLSDARSDSPTTAATLDSFNLKLSLESPTRGSTALPPPPPPPHHGHPYMLNHQFPHHPQACFSHINWVGGRYPGHPQQHPQQQQQQQQQPHGFPAELMSPVDIHFPFRQHGGSGSREFHAFSKVDDTSEADAASTNNAAAAAACTAAGDGAEAYADGGGAAGKEADATVSEDPAPRRTGFMSYLLHQRPQSPPLEPCPSSPPAPPAAPSAADAAVDTDL